MFLKPLMGSVARLSGKVPLRIVLVVPFVIQIFGAVGLVGYLSFKNGQKAVNDVADQLRHAVTKRVEQHLQDYLHQPDLINQINTDAAKRGELAFDNFATSEYFLWQQIQRFNSIYAIYIGSEEGQFIYVKREEDGKLLAKPVERSPERITYRLDSEGQRTQLLKIEEYDPRKRPWYTQTIQLQRPNWSEVYNFSGGELGITASRFYYDTQGTIRGVMGVDLVLSLISDFLNSIDISPHGQSFIIERSGFLVATSTHEKPFILNNNDKKAKRLPATESQNLLTRNTVQNLVKHFGDLNQIHNSEQLDFWIDGQRQFAQVVPYKDNLGLNWLIVVVVPEADFMRQIHDNNRTTILLCLAALVIATTIGIATTQYIVKPILQLKDAAKELSEGQFDKTVNLERSDELGVLAHAFNRMARQLQESFTTLESQNNELQRLDKLKDEFLANTSHELRTPLNGIIGIAESLIDGATGPLSEPTHINLSLIVSSGKRLSTLINDILDFSKLKHKNIELKIQPIGVREIVDVILTLSQPLVGKKNLQLINSISPELPLVIADENRLQQILYNLIGNAIKFTESGTVEVTAKPFVVSSLKPENAEVLTAKPFLPGAAATDSDINYLAITVSDTGIGVPEDQLEQIFESFEQGDGSTAREYSGTGLGLAVSKQLVELHGGQIWVSSTVGIGSQFTFSLPLSQIKSDVSSSETKSYSPSSFVKNQELVNQQASKLSFSHAATPPEAEPETGDRLKILVVDDEPINLQVLSNSLSLENYAIVQATNGMEAIALLEEGYKPDLMLLDVMMPRMTGYEVCQIVREKFPALELPIVMLTAKNQTEDLVEAFDLGANDYLTKPFVKKELLARIKTHIRLAKLNAAYGRFVPHEFLNLLGQESIVDVKLGDNLQKEMSVLFSDIRSFTTLSELMTPEENFAFINAYLGRVSPVIRKYHGFIDKYIGDAVMALFPESAEYALQAAIEMQQEVTLYNQERQKNGYLPITIGIGLHTGSLMLGTIGESQRMESTVIADAVNLASRLEGLTKVYGSGILISHKTLCYLDYSQKHNFRFLDRVMVKGKKAPVAIFEVCDGDSEDQKELKSKTKARFEVAVFMYYQKHFEEAKEIFQEVFQENPQDQAAQLYIERCEKHLKLGVPDTWNAVEILTEK